MSIKGQMQLQSTRKRNRVIFAVGFGLSALVIVMAVVCVSMYFGAVVTGNKFKVARQIFHTDDGNVVEQVIRVTDSEVSVTVPNEVETIYDYRNGLVVLRYVFLGTKIKSACYARVLNESEAPSTDSRSYTDGEQMMLKKTYDKPGSQNWVGTSRKVSTNVFSEGVATMCEDTDIFWMDEAEDSEATKSADCYPDRYTYVCIHRASDPNCAYHCEFGHVCKTASGKMYIFAETEGSYCLGNCIPGNDNSLCS